MKRGGGACQIIDPDATHFMCPDPRSGCEDKEPPLGGLLTLLLTMLLRD